MAKRPKRFEFEPQKYLGSAENLRMDWIARGMQMHLICIAWQETPPCTLPDDDRALRDWLGRPRNWSKLKESVFSGWILENGRWSLPWLLDEWNRQARVSKSRRAAAMARWDNRPEGDANASDLHIPARARGLSLEENGETLDQGEGGPGEGGAIASPERLQAVSDLAFQTLGTIPPNTVRFWAAGYPLDWLRSAMIAAEGRNKRSVAYVQGILANYQRNGGPDNHAGPGPGARAEPGKYSDVGVEIPEGDANAE
jgi:hypothetical protein